MAPLVRVSPFCRRPGERFLQVTLLVGPVHHTDHVSTGFASWKILRRLAIVSGSLVTITCSKTNRSVVICLKHVVERRDEADEAKDDDDASLHINGITAANLGIRTGVTRVTGMMLSVYQHEIVPADSAILRVLGRPLPVPTLSFPGSDASRQDMLWPLPPLNSLLEPDKIITVYKDDQVLFYQVTQVTSEDKSLQSCGRVCKGTATTVYRMEHGPCGPCPVLPSIPSCLPSSDQSPPPHPLVPTLIKELSAITATATPAECVRHVKGSEEDHALSVAVDSASSCMGRRCVHVAGLALFAFGSRVVSSPTGSLRDRLQGLEAALHLASRHAPSVLLIQNMDEEELSQDKQTRSDEENRIWSLLRSQLSLFANERANDESGLPQVPPVLVLLSSKMELPVGPLSERLTLPSIQCTRPDPAYIHFLWSAHEQVIPEIPITILEENLCGRGVDEIRSIREQLEQQLSVASDRTASAAATVFKTICQKMDKRHQRKPGMGSIPSVHWKDVGGLANVRREIMDAIELPLEYPHLFPSYTQSGILLFGPPGSGKTLVAKAIATECGLPFSSIKGPELLGSYVGESEARVRGVFADSREQARMNNPQACILFFDELDSLAPRRGEQSSGGNVMDRVVATFLSELDEGADDCSVFVLGATNRPDLLDTSLLRPGRFDRLVYVGINVADHAHILGAQIRRLRLTDDPKIVACAVAEHLPENTTGADLSTIASSALLRAIERRCVEAEDEVERQHQEGNYLTVDQLLQSWDQKQLQPLVTVEDLLKASENIVPSVSAADLERYDQLRDAFQK